jgi:hypothetical protein
VSTIQIAPRRGTVSDGQRERLQRHARWLARGGIAWHFLEFGIALAAGIAASSIALIGFGADSLIAVDSRDKALWDGPAAVTQEANHWV